MKYIRALMLQAAVVSQFSGLPLLCGLAMAQENEIGSLTPEGKVVLINPADQDIYVNFSSGEDDAGELLLLRRGQRAKVPLCPPKCLARVRTDEHVESKQLEENGRYALVWDGIKQAWVIEESSGSH